MGERKHKAEGKEKKAKVKPGIKTSPQVTNPILQMQQLVGNKTVTKMIQRHPQNSEDIKVIDFNIKHLTDGVNNNAHNMMEHLGWDHQGKTRMPSQKWVKG